jgi:hypothetical protein
MDLPGGRPVDADPGEALPGVFDNVETVDTVDTVDTDLPTQAAD